MNNDKMIQDVKAMIAKYEATGKIKKAEWLKFAGFQQQIINQLLQQVQVANGVKDRLIEINIELGQERDMFSRMATELIPCDTWA